MIGVDVGGTNTDTAILCRSQVMAKGKRPTTEQRSRMQIYIRGHVQTIFGKVNVITMLRGVSIMMAFVIRILIVAT